MPRTITSTERNALLVGAELAQAEQAVADLEVVEQRARDRVAAARAVLEHAEAELEHIVSVEAPATRGRLERMRAAGPALLVELREGRI